MPKENKKLFGCSAPVRPILCIYDSNYCCLNCDVVKECTAKTKALPEGSIKAMPCTLEVFDEFEFCQFAV